MPTCCRIVDEGDHAHGTLAPRAFERIDFVDLVNQARPSGAHQMLEAIGDVTAANRRRT